MNALQPIGELTKAKLREMLREPEMVFWTFVFPILMALVLGLAFRDAGPETLQVGVADEPGAEWIHDALAGQDGIEVSRAPLGDAERGLTRGDLDIVVVPGEPWTYVYDPARPDGERARLTVDDRLQRAAGRSDPRAATTRIVEERGSRYVDFLVPGLLGMNLMGTGMWGIGFYVVSARSNLLLKRLVSTPMRRWHYLAAQIGGRLLFLFLEVGVVLGFAAGVMGVPVRGSWITLAVVSLLGAMAFCGLGLLVAARPRTIEGVSGLMNATMVPMWIMSGIFFSTSRFPDFLQPVVQALPLTAVIDALRGVMLDGAGFVQLAGELGIIVAWTVVTFVLALRWFRWQ